MVKKEVFEWIRMDRKKTACMLTETMVLVILQVSITGAGLIMAIYALITPVARSMFTERVELRKKKKEEFDKIKKKISSNSQNSDFKRLETLASEIKKIKTFPKYLGFGVSLVFSSCMHAMRERARLCA